MKPPRPPHDWPGNLWNSLWADVKAKADGSLPLAFPIAKRTFFALKSWKAQVEASGMSFGEFDVNEELKKVLLPTTDPRTVGLLGGRDEPTKAELVLTAQNDLGLPYSCERRPRAYVFARYGVLSFGSTRQLRFVRNDAVRSTVSYLVFRQTFAPKDRNTTVAL